MSAPDFSGRLALNTGAGEFLVGTDLWRSRSLSRTLPAGQYKVLAISTADRDAGAYTLTIQTGRLAAPPPPPPPEETTTDVDQDEEQTLPPVETEAEAVRGYVLARVHPLPENDRRGAYRIEFGFLSEEVLASGSDRTAVVEANEHLLPPRRYLNEASMLERARDNNRNWLRSSPIDVFPLEGDDATLSGKPLLTGRVIARWNPTPGGRFQIEFGFLPEWAIEAAGGDTQRAAEMQADLLPDPGRYLSQSHINREVRRDAPRWLTSSLAEIPPEDPGREPICTDPVTITPIAVPLTLPRGEAISDESIAIISGELAETFRPVDVQDLPPGLEWDLAETSAGGCEHQLTVSGTIPARTAARSYSVQITAEGADGTRTTETIRIDGGGDPPPLLEITWDGYTPDTTSIGGSVQIIQPRVTRPITPPPGVNWEFKEGTPTTICSVNSQTGALTLSALGVCQITVTASAPGYSPGTATAQVTITDLPISVISWSGYSQSSVGYGEAAPTLVPPRATLNGRTIRPQYRYSLDSASASACSVTPDGSLTILAVGECRVNVENVANPPQYGVGKASASVRVNPGDPGLRWRGYSPTMVQSRDSTPRLLQPTAVARTIRFSYSSLTPSVCSVNSDTGALTLVAEDGACIVQVSTSGDPNYRTATETATVTIVGVQKPVVRISCTPPSIDEGQSVTCRVTRNDGHRIVRHSWSADGGSPSRGSDSTYSPSFSREGTYTVTLTASNDGGDSDPARTIVNVRGTPPPDITISCSPPSTEEGESVMCWASNRGGKIDRYSWRANGGSPSSSSSDTYSPSFSREGTYTVSLTASNAGGSDDDDDTVMVERSTPPPPDITISCSPSSIEEGESVTCRVTRNRGGDIDRYSWRANGGSPSSGSSDTYSPSFSREGTYTVSLTASNAGGSDDDDDTVMVERSTPPPPDITISCSPSSIEEGESVTCRVTRNRGGDIDRYSWRANGGSPSSGSSDTYSPSFNSAGTYTVSLTASNAGDDDDDRVRVTVTRGVEPPSGNISCIVATTEVGESIRCGWNWTGGGRPTSLVWRGGDSDSGNSEELYYPSFRSPGTKTVSLTVSNAGGSAIARVSVRVVPPPPSTQYGRCGSDRIRVYYFERWSYTKRWLNMTWEEVSARVSGWGEHMIGYMSQSDCNSWPNGTNLTTSNWPPRR